MLNSLSHEVVHYIKEMSPDKFRKLADFVVGKFGEKGVSVTRLIRAKQSKYAAQGQELSFMDAYEEVVADSVESMLSQKTEKIISDIAEMRKVDADLAKTFVDKVKDLVGKMLNVFKKNKFQVNPETEEGKFFAKWSEFGDELSGIFAEAAADAADKAVQAARRTDTLTKSSPGDTVQKEHAKNMARNKYMEYFPSSHKNGDTHYWCTIWGKSPLVRSGDYALVDYNGKHYEIQKHDDADFGYRIISQLTNAQYNRRKELGQYAYDLSSGNAGGGIVLADYRELDKKRNNLTKRSAHDNSPMSNAGGNVGVQFVGSRSPQRQGGGSISGVRTDGSGKRHTSGSSDTGVSSGQSVKEDTGDSGVSSYAEKSSQRTLTKENTPAAARVKNSIRRTTDGIEYVKLDGNIFVRPDGTEMTKREAYNALVGKTITLEDGDKITFIKNLPGGRSVYNELFNKRPGYDPGIDVVAVSDKINRNIVETLKASTMKTPNEMQRHPHVGIVDFDLREVYLADDNKAYRLELNIANLTDGTKIAYVKRYVENASTEVNKKIRMAETARQSPLNRPSDETSKNDVFISSIRQGGQKSQEETEKNSRRNLNERQIIVDMLKSLPYEVEHNQYFQEYLDKVESLDSKQAKEGLA